MREAEGLALALLAMVPEMPVPDPQAMREAEGLALGLLATVPQVARLLAILRNGFRKSM